MARIVLGSYMVRYPLGGMMSWVLQYLVGFQQLGHQVWFVEKSGWANACYDPAQHVMTDDCSYGIRVVDELLARFGLQGKWCFVDAAGRYHGLSRERIEAVFDAADLFVDMGTHGSWLDEAAKTGLCVLVDGEPAFTQMKMEQQLARGQELLHYDHYYTTGVNIGTAFSTAPSAGIPWRPLFHPVATGIFSCSVASPEAPFTTVMNWQSYEPLEYRGSIYGHKDVEFGKFLTLPGLTSARFELAVAGKDVPTRQLRAAGWGLADAHEVTISFNSFVDYIRSSRGEFGVCKSGFVRTQCGWFSDRSAAYLATGRPVVLQDTGFSARLPCGQGLFAVRSVEEAAAAAEAIAADYAFHARRAREVAEEFLEARVVLGRFLDDLGI